MRRYSKAIGTALAACVLALASGSPAPAFADDDDEIEIEDPEGEAEPEIEIEPEEASRDLDADTAAAESEGQGDATMKTEGPLGDYRVAWQDIVTVIRKPFLKVRRWDIMPTLSTTMNDNMVRHFAAGGQLNYFLTDVLAVGLEGQYYSKQFREPFDLVARQARRLPTINQYNWSAALNFHYVPVYGKFAVLDKHIITWETYFTAGFGVMQSEVVPRDPRFAAFSNFLISPNLGASMRFFLFKWMTVNLGLRDYLFVDKFEPVGRSETMYGSAADAKANADTAFINNVVFQFGVSFWLPPTFEYTTFR